jgi:hypothetical protein
MGLTTSMYRPAAAAESATMRAEMSRAMSDPLPGIDPGEVHRHGDE